MPGAGQHKGRVVMKAISTSQKVAALRSPWQKLLYTWLIPHADNLGRLEGDPWVVRSMIFPREKSVQPSKVKRWLEALHSGRLICYYEVDTDHFIQIHNFTSMNPPRGNMRMSSDLPPAPTDCSVCGRFSRCSNLFESVSPEYEQEQEDEQDGTQQRAVAKGLPQRTVEQIVESWNTMVAALPDPVKIRKLLKITPGTDRHRGLRARIADGMLEHWDTILDEVRRSQFLQGHGKPWGKHQKPFVLTLDWLVLHKGNWLKVAEGSYRDRQDDSGTGDSFTDSMAQKEI